MYRKDPWNTYSAEEKQQLEQFAADYRRFLSDCKTEREVCAFAVQACKEAGFKDLKDAIRTGEQLHSGDRVYCSWMEKSFVAFIIGIESPVKGMNILGAHIDSPRIDIKQNPLYDSDGLCYLDTHYYGGIKKYQWASIPLALHGIVCLKDGSSVQIIIGEKEDDPVFFISDLLIHLSRELMTKPASEVMTGEGLDLIIGNHPKEEEDGSSVKAAVLDILKDQYGIEEEDFLSAELEVVPAYKARDIGLDRSMIGGYGHDDRSCAYPSLRALLACEGTPTRTLCTIMTDKEEIGSVGATGMTSRYFENIVADLLDACGEKDHISLRRCLANSMMLSSDVSAGYDPNFAASFEKKNAAFIGQGVCFNKYVGSGGKGGSNDANAEFIAVLRKAMDDANVAWQTAEIGRVDAGGGGTIAYMCAKFGMQVIDCGVPVLSMHAPYELIGKNDLWEAFKCYKAFLSL